jgi:adenylate cyclase
MQLEVIVMSGEVVTGGCLCGAIRYESSEPPFEAGICHCRTCQKSTGSAFEVIAGFYRTSFRFTNGEPKLFRSSSIMEKGFCPNCGSLLFDQYLVRTGKSNPDMVWIQLGTLDHPEAVSINLHTGVESQLPWVHFDDSLPRSRCDEAPNLAAAFATAEVGNQ